MDPRFTTTRWSVVLSAGAARTPASADALETLCRAYWYPLYAYARRWGRSPDDAQDVVQGFFARLLENGALGAADPGRGRFRSFLLTSFRNFITNESARASARKRGGGVSVLSIDAARPEERYALEPVTDETPDRLFLRSWALALLRTVLGRLRAAYADQGKEALFERLEPFIVGAGDGSYGDAAEATGLTAGALRVTVHRLRRRYRDTLREEVAQTLSERGDEVPEAAIRDEISELLAALGGRPA